MTLTAMLSAFDEAALATLANKGILRRAARDVEEGKVTVSTWDDGIAVVLADGETVRIDARGPAKATCTCPAPGICRHRVSAVLLLQQGAEESPPAAPIRLVDEIAAIAEETLIRFAGRATWRAALEIAGAGGEATQSGAALVIRLTGKDIEIRYLPGLGIDGMVSKASPARRKALHMAALILVRRSAGIEPAGIETAGSADSQAGIDPNFLEDVRAALADACRDGLAFAPLALEERLFTLSVSLRADALPRLGAMLRGIARALRERRARSFRFDPDACLGAIAAADALTRALATASDPARRARLAGSVRQDFAATGPLHLHGLGGETWRAEGGARGATAWFYDHEGDQWFTSSLARGAGQDPFFDPRQAFYAEAIWHGQTLASLSRTELRFESIGASPQRRLSASAATQPELLGPSAPSVDWVCSFDRWLPLTERLRNRLSGNLSAPAPTSEPVILWPRRAGRPWFDDLTQRLFWPLEDVAGEWIAVSLVHDPDRAAHFDHLASTAFRAGYGGAIIAAASMSGTSFELRPIALADANGLRSLDFEEPTAPKRSFADFLRLYSRRGRGTFLPRPKSASMALLDEVATELTAISETGCRAIAPAASRRLSQMTYRAEQAGLMNVARSLTHLGQTPEFLARQVLITRHVIDQTRPRLMALPMLKIA